jgi:3-phosphoshikimate 1-carboxyvinyltransferase
MERNSVFILDHPVTFGATPPRRGIFNSFNIDISGCPDLAPILAVVMAYSSGVSIIVNGARLRLKECDRFAAICAMLKTLNVKFEAEGDNIAIYGTGGKPFDVSGSIEGFADHRMVMAGVIAATLSKEGAYVTCPEAVSKSYPAFFEDFKSLGGIVE